MESKNKPIELRSEKVRNIIGQIPTSLIRNGTLIICIVLLILIIISIFIPYRETIPVRVKIETSFEACFVHSSKDGMFVSDSIPATVSEGSLIGYIVNKDTIENITSPVKGELQMNVNNAEYLNRGKLLCAVIPEGYIYYGTSEVPAEDYYKIKEGNKILIALNRDQTIDGIVEKVHPFSDNRNCHAIRIRFVESTLLNRQSAGTIYNGKVILYDISILKKFISSINPKV